MAVGYYPKSRGKFHPTGAKKKGAAILRGKQIAAALRKANLEAAAVSKAKTVDIAVSELKKVSATTEPLHQKASEPPSKGTFSSGKAPLGSPSKAKHGSHLAVSNSNKIQSVACPQHLLPQICSLSMWRWAPAKPEDRLVPYELTSHVKGCYFPLDRSCLQWLPSGRFVKGSHPDSDGDGAGVAKDSTCEEPLLMYVDCYGFCFLISYSQLSSGVSTVPTALTRKFEQLTRWWPAPVGEAAVGRVGKGWKKPMCISTATLVVASHPDRWVRVDSPDVSLLLTSSIGEAAVVSAAAYYVSVASAQQCIHGFLIPYVSHVDMVEDHATATELVTFTLSNVVTSFPNHRFAPQQEQPLSAALEE